MWTRYEHVKSAIKNSMLKKQQVLTYRSVACFLFEVFTVKREDYLQGEMQFSHINDETVQLVGKPFSVFGKK